MYGGGRNLITGSQKESGGKGELVAVEGRRNQGSLMKGGAGGDDNIN